MSDHALMQKEGEGRMNVPPEKVEAYKLEGWVVIDRPPEPAPPIQAVPIESKAKSPADDLPGKSDQTPGNVDKVVERVTRRSKKGAE